MSTKTKAITITKPKRVKKANDISTNTLLEIAVNKDIDFQKLEKLIELKNKEEGRLSKQEFDFHFAQMQKDFLPAIKNKTVTNQRGELLYSYCPLGNILKVYQPIISKHGFSYRWSEESIKEGREIKMWCIVSGYGHEERTAVDIPIMPGNSFTNAVQQRGSASTYGKRYSFMDAFGIIIEDEDDEGNGDSKTKVADNGKVSITLADKEKPTNADRDTVATPEACVNLINKLKSSRMKIKFAKCLNAIREKYKGNTGLLTKKLEILIKNLKEEKRHLSASFFNELDKELSGSSVTG